MYGKFMAPNNADEFLGSTAGHIGAIPNMMIVLYASAKVVIALQGGFQSWKDAGYKITTDDVPKKPVSDFGHYTRQTPYLLLWHGLARERSFFNAWLMGREHASIFDRGWFEGSNNPNNPFETGDPYKRTFK